VDEIVLRRGLANAGDTIVIVAGTPLGGAGKTNMLKLHTVGDET
jgi:pyruvate kinase